MGIYFTFSTAKYNSTNMDAINNLPERQKAEFLKHLNEQTVKDSMRMYNNLVESCTEKCIGTGWGGGLSSKNLDDHEGKCVSNCADKFLKVSQRVGFRFSEYQAAKAQGLQ